MLRSLTASRPMMQAPTSRPAAPALHQQRVAEEQEENPVATAKLDTLQAKLQEETEKIVRWKVNTEVNLSQKCRELEESSETIAGLRHNLMEMQLTSEQLSQALDRERQHRDQVYAKVNTTRQMACVVQRQQEQLKSVSQQFAEQRQELMTQQEGAIEQLHRLRESCEKMAETYTSALQEATYRSEEFRQRAQAQQSQLKQQLQTAREQLQHSTDALHGREEELYQCKEELASVQHQLRDIEEDKRRLHTQLEQMTSKLKDFQLASCSEIDSLKKQMDVLQANFVEEKKLLAECRCDLSLAADRIQGLEAVNNTLEEHRIELQDRIEQLDHDTARLREESSQLSSEVVTLQGERDSALRETSHLKSLMVDLQDQLIAAQESCKRQQELLQTLRQDATNMDLELQEARSRLETVLAEATTLSEAERTAQQHLQEALAQHEAAIASTNNELQKQRNEATQSRQQAEAAHRAAQEATDCCSDLKQQREQISERLKECQQELRCQSGEFERLRAEAANKGDALDQLQQQYGDLYTDYNAKMLALTMRLEDEQKQTGVAESRAAAQEAAATAARESLLAAEERETALHQQLQDANENLHSIQMDNTKNKDAITAFTSELSSASETSKIIFERNAALLDELKEKNAEVKSLEKELRASKKSLSAESKKAEKLKATVEKLEKSVERLQQELKMSEETSAAFQQELLEDQTHYRMQAEERMSELKKEKAAAEARVSDLEADVAAAEKRAAHAEEAAGKANANSADARADADGKIKEMLSLLEQQQQQHDASLRNRTQEAKAAEARAVQLQQQLNESEQTADSLREQVTALEGLVQHHQDELQQQREQILAQQKLEQLQAKQREQLLIKLEPQRDTVTLVTKPFVRQTPKQILAPLLPDQSPIIDVVNSPAASADILSHLTKVSEIEALVSMEDNTSPIIGGKSNTTALVDDGDKENVTECAGQQEQSVKRVESWGQAPRTTPTGPVTPQMPLMLARSTSPAVSFSYRGILKPSNSTVPAGGAKHVAFNSPAAVYQLDSDSSDANALEMSSDIEDRFEAILRSRNRGCGRSLMAPVPLANVPPTPRPAPLTHGHENRPRPLKKARVEQRDMKTYSSPYHGTKGGAAAPLQTGMSGSTEKLQRPRRPKRPPPPPQFFTPSRTAALSPYTTRDNIADANNTSFEAVFPPQK